MRWCGEERDKGRPDNRRLTRLQKRESDHGATVVHRLINTSNCGVHVFGTCVTNRCTRVEPLPTALSYKRSTPANVNASVAAALPLLLSAFVPRLFITSLRLRNFRR